MQYEEVKELIAIFEKTDLNDMELTLDNVSLRLNRGRAAVPAGMGVAPAAYNMQNVPILQQGQMAAPVQNNITAETSTGAAAEAKEASQPVNETAPSGGVMVKAPIVGTFYASAAPDKPAFVKVGDTVGEGDTLCIIEAMKFMNEVPSDTSGTVAEILVEDGDFVEYGQELFRIV